MIEWPDRVELIKAPHTVLTTQCAELPVDEDVPEHIYTQMIDIMQRLGGIGLAANQVGLPYRFFFIGLTLYINPLLVSKNYKTKLDTEGCLSNPGVQRRKLRYTEIRVEARNHPQHMLKGLLARIFQHELDHLNGVEF